MLLIFVSKLYENNKMLFPFIRQSSVFKLLFLCAIVLLPLKATTFDANDSRHKFVCGVKAQYAKEIETRKLNTNYHSIRLIDLARERLEKEDASCDWSLVIQCVVRGYGYRDGVSKTEVASDDECQIIQSSYLLSCFYQAALGSPLELKLDEVYSPEKGDSSKLANHINALNKVAAYVPKEVFELGRKNQASTNLPPPPTHNQWTAHERFWAAAGVFDPSIPNVLRSALNTQSAISFVSNLTKQLESAIKLVKPQHQEVVDLIKLSQTIQLTLASGINPKNNNEWEVIRKALFLALSVTSNPGTACNTFLSTLYDCGKFYHQKTDPDEVKKYYFKLDAFARIFSEIWKGNYDLNQVIKDNDLSNYYTHQKRTNTVTGSAFALLKQAYEEAAATTNFNGCKVELTASIALHPKLNHELAFRALYPDLTAKTEYHTPSKMASTLMAGQIVKLKLPLDPQAINLVYENGKWYLKSLKLDSTGKILKEAIIWTGKTKDSLNASIDDARGKHLFNFDVDGNDATIKAISAGYLVHIKGGHTTVGSSKELGIIESSAYALGTDIYTNKETSAIWIEGEGYYGQKGVITASRESVFIQTPIINTSSDKGSLQTSNTVNEGQELSAYKDVILNGNHTNVANTKIFANQDVEFSWVENMGGVEHLITHGSLIHVNRVIYVNTGMWHVDSHTTHASYPNAPSLPNRILTSNEADSYNRSVKRTSGQCLLEFGRHLMYGTSACFVGDPQTSNILKKHPHTYGVFNLMLDYQVPYNIETLVFTLPQGGGGSRGGFGSFGGGSFGGSSSNFGGGGSFGGGRFTSTYDSYNNRFNSNQPSNSSPLQLTNFDANWSSRGGNNFGLSATFGNGISSTTLGLNSHHGSDGSYLNLQSQFNTSLYDQVRLGTMGIEPLKNNSALTLHGLCSAAILGITNKTDKLSVGKVIRDITTLVKIGQPSTTTGRISFSDALIRDFKEAHDIKDKPKVEDNKSKANTGGQMPDPDDGRDKKYPNNPKEKPEDFVKLESKGARINKEDGSVWEKDTSNHGGEQWKRWPNKRDWEKSNKPKSIWPDGTVRK